MGGVLMAHFARIENNTVMEVIVISNEICNVEYPESEILGQSFIAEVLDKSGTWLQTSYNNNFRKQYAGVSYSYHSVADVFITPQPYPSWSLDENFDWQAPIPMPADGFWRWDEKSLNWLESELYL
jgi:hypothetical protein